MYIHIKIINAQTCPTIFILIQLWTIKQRSNTIDIYSSPESKSYSKTFVQYVYLQNKPTL